MSKLRGVLGTLVLVLFAAVSSAPAQTATTVTKKTTVTINHAMEVPGGTVLQPGTYIFRIMDQGQHASDRDIVRITSEDDTKVIATFIAIPDYRLQTTDNPVIEYDEAQAGQPNAMRAWFYAGEVGGLEFVYPRKRATELAAASQEYVPAEENESADMNNEPLVAINPQGSEETMTQAYTPPAQSAQASTPPPPPASVAPAPANTGTESAQTLPRTASPLPLIALLGMGSFFLGLGLRRLARQS